MATAVPEASGALDSTLSAAIASGLAVLGPKKQKPFLSHHTS